MDLMIKVPISNGCRSKYHHNTNSKSYNALVQSISKNRYVFRKKSIDIHLNIFNTSLQLFFQILPTKNHHRSSAQLFHVNQRTAQINRRLVILTETLRFFHEPRVSLILRLFLNKSLLKKAKITSLGWLKKFVYQ